MIENFIMVLFTRLIFFTQDKFYWLAFDDLSASAKFDQRSREKHDRVSAYTSTYLHILVEGDREIT